MGINLFWESIYQSIKNLKVILLHKRKKYFFLKRQKRKIKSECVYWSCLLRMPVLLAFSKGRNGRLESWNWPGKVTICNKRPLAISLDKCLVSAQLLYIVYSFILSLFSIYSALSFESFDSIGCCRIIGLVSSNKYMRTIL